MGRRGRWLAILFGGIGLGIATSLADSLVVGPAGERSWVRAVAIVLNLATIWALAAFFAGRTAGTPTRAAVAGVMTLGAAIVGYYAFGMLVGDRTHVGWQSLVGVARQWFALAMIVGPVFGFAGRWSAQPSPLAFLAIIPLPLLALAEVFGRVGWSTADLNHDPVMGWTLLAVVSLAVGTLLALLVRLAATGVARRRRPRG